jgi:hypothetical protein
MLRRRLLIAIGLLGCLGLAASPALALEEIWNLETVDSSGNGTHPSLNLLPTDPAAWVTFQGIVLNRPQDMLSTSMQWQIFVQALPTSPTPNAGIALWAGIFYNVPGDAWPRYTNDWLPGDVVQVTGLLINNNGKTNVGERHDADYPFTVSLLSHGSLPAPRQIPSIAAAIAFDETRLTGGENYQGQWCRLDGASVVSGTWGAGSTVQITDSSGGTMDMVLGLSGFAQTSAPPGRFNITAIFDQEDKTSPYTGTYRFWPTTYGQIALWGDANNDGVVDPYDSDILSAHYGMTTGATWAMGDFNGDGAVNDVDNQALLANYGYAPEPATLGLLTLGGLGIAAIRRRSRRA